ncbi:sensor domain-containing protein [Oceanisphaera avium]|uniref:Diguanylate cyclase n=1 Tax=Oceanisphaera avium TaxID=1903694 RepID=A0A1Y0CWI9_9GAMM|nr:diguanylate cyclase [Oceanisphaera avium]ART79257.1 hypothetical protein CBP12_03100 [Oceanisphaera avium]
MASSLLPAHALSEQALDHIELGVALFCSEQKVQFWNQWLVRYSGISAEHALGKRLNELFPSLPSVLLEAVTSGAKQGLSRVLSHQLHGQLLPLRSAKEQPVFHSVVLRPLAQANGEQALLMQVHDITNAIKRERHLKDKQQALHLAHRTQSEEKQFIDTVLETISALVVVTDTDGIIINMNRSAEWQSGFSQEQLVGQPLKMLLGLDSFKHLSDKPLASNEIKTFNCRMTNVLNEAIEVRWTVKAVKEDKDPLRYIIYTGQDVTERERADALLRLEREMLEMTAGNEQVEHILNHACLTLERQLESCRVAVLDITDDNTLRVRSGPQLSARFCEQLHQLANERLVRVLQIGLDAGQLQVFTVQPKGAHWQAWLDLAKEYKMAGCWLMPIQVNPARSQNLLAVFPRYKSNPCPHERMMIQRIGHLTALILERQQQQEQIKRLALQDSLTGLANRVLLGEQLQRSISRAKRHASGFALLFIDLNGFKEVNDTHGHDAGDALLAGLAQRLTQRFRATDCCARIGGDEFVVLLDEVASSAVAFSLAQSVLTLVAKPFIWGEQTLNVSASIGIGLFPEDGDSPAALLTRADNAMYQAKAQSKRTGQGCVMRIMND